MVYRHQRAPQGPRIIDARRPGICAQTGAQIKPGDSILWDAVAGVAYCHGSARYVAHAEQQRLNTWNAAHGMADANW